MKYILALLAVLSASPALAKPITFDKVSGSPGIELCVFEAFKKNKTCEKWTVFMTACDFKADWARRR